MAHVFDIPTYRNAVANRVARYLIIHGANEDLDVTEQITNSGLFTGNFDADTCYELTSGFRAQAQGDTCVATSPSDIEILTNTDLLYAYLRALSKPSTRIRAPASLIFHSVGKRKWYADFAAQTIFLKKVLMHEIDISIPKSLPASFASACKAAMDWAVIQVPYMKLSHRLALPIFRNMTERIKRLYAGDSTCLYRYAIANAIEHLITENTSHGPVYCEEDLKKHTFKRASCHANLTSCRITKADGLLMFIFKNEVLIFNNIHAKHLSECIMYWSNAAAYSALYRITGHMGTSQGDIPWSVEALTKWVADHLSPSNEALARDMKQSMSRLFNDLHANLDMPELGWHDRSVGFEINENNNFYQFVVNLPISDRAKIDLAHSYHGLPAPDADIQLVSRNMMLKQSAQNYVDPSDLEEFLAYCRTMDLIRILNKHGESAYRFIYEHATGIQVSKTHLPEWVKSAAHGDTTYPPVEEFGKLCIRGIYPSIYEVENWFLDARDVTHVYNCGESYQGKIEDNEILYVLRKGPMLSNHISPLLLKEIIASPDSHVPWDTQATLAAKKENTKYGDRVRETISASDVLREANTAFDLNAIPITHAMPGISLRASASEVGSQFTMHAMHTTTAYKHLIVSTDIKSWSPKANREAIFAHHEYLQTLTTKPVFVKHLWDKMWVRSMKQNVDVSFKSPGGMFQGWTGTTDTIFHVHMISWSIRRLKNKGILLPDEQSSISTLIDDAVVSLSVSSRRSDEDVSRLCREFYNELRDCYMKLGMEIDETKTLVSARKYVFLNQMYLDGSEVLTSMKTFCRIGKAGKREVSGTLDKINEIISQTASAISKGSDPYSTYMFGSVRALQPYFFKIGRKALRKSRAQIILKAILPNTAGGLGIPSMTKMMTTCILDDFSHIMSTLYNYSTFPIARDYLLLKAVRVAISSIKNLPYRLLTPLTAMTTPRAIVTDAPRPPWDIIASRICRASHNYATDPFMKAIFNSAISCDYMEACDKFLSSIAIDASILENLSSTLPHVLAHDLAAKFEKSATILSIMGAAEKRRALLMFYRADKSFLLYDIPVSEAADIPFCEDSYDAVREIRKLKIIPGKYHITNLTLPDPADAIGHSARTDVSYVEYKTPIAVSSDKNSSIWSSVRDCYLNLYDARSHRGPFYPKRSKDAISSSVITHKMPDGFSRRILHMLAVESVAPLIKGVCPGSIEAIVDFFKSAWDISEFLNDVSLLPSKSDMFSTKRINSASATDYHDIRPFRNTASCPLVKNFTFARVWDQAAYHLDLLSVTTMMRFNKIMDTAILNCDTGRTYFDVPVTFRAVTESISCLIYDPDLLAIACNMMRDSYGSRLSILCAKMIRNGFTTHIISKKSSDSNHTRAVPDYVYPPSAAYHVTTIANTDLAASCYDKLCEHVHFDEFIKRLKRDGYINPSAVRASDVIEDLKLFFKSKRTEFRGEYQQVALKNPEFFTDIVMSYIPIPHQSENVRQIISHVASAAGICRSISALKEMCADIGLANTITQAIVDAYTFLFTDREKYMSTGPWEPTNPQETATIPIISDEPIDEELLKSIQETECLMANAVELIKETRVLISDPATIAAYYNSLGMHEQEMHVLHDKPPIAPIEVPKSFLEEYAELIAGFKGTSLKRRGGTPADVTSPKKRARFAVSGIQDSFNYRALPA